MALLPGIIKSVLSYEESPKRFENFCIDLCSKVFDIVYLPTSYSYDQGRDGRSISNPSILCASIEKKYESKIESDINKLLETTETDSLVFCSSQPLSERKIDEIKSKLFVAFPKLKHIDILGLIQLTKLGELNEAIVEKYYHAELYLIKQAFFNESEPVSEAKNIGLRLALLVHASDDSSELRKELSSYLILNTLLKKDYLGPDEISNSIKEQLHLSQKFSNAHINILLSELKLEGLIDLSEGKVSLKASGKEKVNNLPEKAVEKLLEGRIAIRKALSRLSGHNLNDSQYEQLWTIFQDEIANLFYLHGLSVVEMIKSLLNDETPKDSIKNTDIYHQIEILASKATICFDNKTQRDEISQAIQDIFYEKESEAFHWLTQICSIYVMLCSLGLENFSSKQISDILLDFTLVPDSDVILSLLCEAESNHEAILNIVKYWKAIGGILFLSKPVLDEVAYHAWISENDYNGVENSLDKIDFAQASYLVKTAFVRTFKKKVGHSTSRKSWNFFINQYRGAFPSDSSKIVEILRDEYGFMLPVKDYMSHEEFREKIYLSLLDLISKEQKCDLSKIDPNDKDKASRDAQLFTMVYIERLSKRSSYLYPSICIVSSARKLRQINDKFRDDYGQPDAVLSIAAISFMLSLCPQIKMGLNTLRLALFDQNLAVKLNPLQRHAYRVISASSGWKVPLSRRTTLQTELRNAIISEATARGKSEELITKRFIQNKDPDLSTIIIAEALDKMGIESAYTKNAKAENIKLRKELEAEKAKKIKHVFHPPKKRKRR